MHQHQVSAVAAAISAAVVGIDLDDFDDALHVRIRHCGERYEADVLNCPFFPDMVEVYAGGRHQARQYIRRIVQGDPMTIAHLANSFVLLGGVDSVDSVDELLND